MTDLDKLIEAVEVGDSGNKFWQAVHVIPPRHITNVTLARDGSLDAAKALHAALLPGWTAAIGQNAHHADWSAWVRLARGGEVVSEYTASLDDPARAWLLAILKAYRTTQEALK